MSTITDAMRADPSMIHVPVPTAQTTWGRLDACLGDADERPAYHQTRGHWRSGEWVAGRGQWGNTRIRRLVPGSMFGPIAVRYHRTDIITAHVDGRVEIRTDGWLTPTTKERINAYLPSFREGDRGFGAQLAAHRGYWRVSRYVFRHDLYDALGYHDPYVSLHEDESDFYEGMVLDAHGLVVGARLFHTGDPDAGIKAKIRAYIAGYTDDVIAGLVRDAAERGTAGDCWFCAMRRPADGVPLGEIDGDTGHLEDHVAEGYRMASLLYNAVEAKGYPEPMVILHHAPDLARRALSYYLTNKLARHTSGARPTGATERGWYGAA